MNEPRRFRFSVRDLLVFVFLIAVCAAFPVTILFVVFIAPLTGPAIWLIAFLVARSVTCSRDAELQRRWPSLLGWFTFSLALFPFLGVWFVRHRWVNCLFETDFPRPFPFPDLFLLEIHDWWDRLNPSSPGSLKMHGEIFAVTLGVNTVILIACLLFGGICGFVFRNGDFVAVSRRLTSHRTQLP